MPVGYKATATASTTGTTGTGEATGATTSTGTRTSARTATGEAVFVPADPPRAGTLALWGPGVDDDSNSSINGGAADEVVELVMPAGAGVRRKRVPARLLSLADALELLVAPPPPDATVSYRAWSAAALAGIGLIARGRLLPDRTESGTGSWRVGPLDAQDHAWLRELAAAMPTAAHAVPIIGSRPLRVQSPTTLVRAFWDAIADTFVRTSAAVRVSGAHPFAAAEPLTVPGSTDWLTDSRLADRAGASVVLRIEPPEEPADDPSDDPSDDPADTATDEGAEPYDNTDEGAPADGLFRGVLQLRSAADPSLIVDVADLWNAPGAVLQRLGASAETDLLLALRRGARAWPPLSSALSAATPTDLELDDAAMETLLTKGADALRSAGIEVLWPSELFGGGLSVKAGATTPTPPGGVEPAFSLHDLLEFRWQPLLDGEALTEDEIATLADAKRSLIRLRGRWVHVDKTQLERLRHRRDRTLGAAEALAAAISGEINLDGEAVEFHADGPVADLADLLTGNAGGVRELPEPDGLLATLRPYQRRGLAWLAELTNLGLGACLADDMGLGKTLQLIALHLHRRDRAYGPTLVVCPTSLLGTWQREIERFAPKLPVRRFHGGSRDLADLAPDEVVLTTYGVVRHDHEQLATVRWGLAVADEAQHAKNPLSRTARTLRTIRAAARVALTGTPVENRLSELWSILDWTTPGILGSLEKFRHNLAIPVERYRDADAMARLGRVTSPFLLRRRKSDPGIAPELPPKTESDLVVSLTSEQATLYKAVVDDILAKINESAGIERRGLVLSLLTALKQICNHPAQYLHEPGPIDGRSGKLAAVEELLDVIVAEGESVLVFSQYVEMLDLLARHLDERGIGNQTLHGGVGSKRREQLVESFQAGEVPVFLLSLKAGGVGLTLTRAAHVIHYDRWWNPAVEDQATDRAYRIGQDHAVQVHRLLTEGTLEDRIASLIDAKRELADAVMGSGEAWLTELSNDELADLVRLGGR